MVQATHYFERKKHKRKFIISKNINICCRILHPTAYINYLWPGYVYVEEA